MRTAGRERTCHRGFTTRYVRMPRLLHEFAVGRGDGSYTRLLTRLAKLDLLALLFRPGAAASGSAASFALRRRRQRPAVQRSRRAALRVSGPVEGRHQLAQRVRALRPGADELLPLGFLGEDVEDRPLPQVGLLGPDGCAGHAPAPSSGCRARRPPPRRTGWCGPRHGRAVFRA